MQDNYKKFGFTLVWIGIIGFISAIIVGYKLNADVRSALPALSFLVTMFGISFCFPSLLEESKGQLSTMRIVVFAVTMVFCVIYIRLAWNLSAFEKLTIDQKWVYILGLAFGGKVIQKFGEEETGKDSDDNKDDTSA